MSVRHQITEQNGLFFITFTCARWLPLFAITNTYDAVYKWFDYLKQQGHYVVGYVIMPNHLHTMIAFSQTDKNINTIVGNGKRFMAYEIVKQLKLQEKTDILTQLSNWVNNTDRKRNKQHEVFEPSFDCKECKGNDFINQKLNYIHNNPCRYNPILANAPEEYIHSSAGQYIGINDVKYSVTTYAALQDIGLTTTNDK